MEVQVNDKISDQEFNKLLAPMQLDLIAYYNLLLEKMNKIVRQAAEEGWTEEEMIQKINEELDA